MMTMISHSDTLRRVDKIVTKRNYRSIMASSAKPQKPDRSKYMAEYYLRRRDELRQIKHQRYLDNRDEIIAAQQERNREKNKKHNLKRAEKMAEAKRAARAAKGAKPRTEPPPGVRISPPLRRRWLIIGDRIYFNSRLGFSPAEVNVALSELKTAIAARLEGVKKS